MAYAGDEYAERLGSPPLCLEMIIGLRTEAASILLNARAAGFCHKLSLRAYSAGPTKWAKPSVKQTFVTQLAGTENPARGYFNANGVHDLSAPGQFALSDKGPFFVYTDRILAFSLNRFVGS